MSVTIKSSADGLSASMYLGPDEVMTLKRGGVYIPGSISSPSAFGFKNKFINGAMPIDQRKEGAVATVTGGAGYWSADRWTVQHPGASKSTVQRVDAPVGMGGHAYALKITITASHTLTVADAFWIQQIIEGYNTADLCLGTPNAQTFTDSFWVQSSVPGTYLATYANGAVDRSYTVPFTITSANVPQKIEITVPGCTTGTWDKTNGYGLRRYISLGSGPTYSGTAFNQWNIGSVYLTQPGFPNFAGTVGATFYITGCQLEKGSYATEFEHRPHGIEKLLCLRYFFKSPPGAYYVFWSGTTTSGLGYYTLTTLPVEMRSTPSVAYIPVAASGFPNIAGTSFGVTPNTVGEYRVANASSSSSFGSSVEVSAEL